MKICPKKNIEILSPLKKDEVIELFRQKIEHNDRFGIWGIRHKSFRDYEGYIENDRIKFRRILKVGANSFIPQICGLITETKSETSIRLNARLDKVVEGFIIGFQSFLILLIAIGLINIDSSSEILFHVLFLVGLIVMFIIMNGMTRIIFNFELYRLEKDLRKILSSNEKRPSNDNRLNRIQCRLVKGIL